MQTVFRLRFRIIQIFGAAGSLAQRSSWIAFLGMRLSGLPDRTDSSWTKALRCLLFHAPEGLDFSFFPTPRECGSAGQPTKGLSPPSIDRDSHPGHPAKAAARLAHKPQADYRKRYPVNSPIPYLGGKSRLAKTILPRIQADHACYVEPFCGSAKIFFAKQPSKTEVLNDADGELVTFWRVVQNHLQPFLDYFKWAVVSRKLFELEEMKRPETLTDIQRAVRYFYVQRLGFGGHTTGRTYGTVTKGGPRLNLTDLEESLLQVHWRLERVNIECLDALECIRRYDRPHTFFFIDPPYMGGEDDYAVRFDRFQTLADLVAGIKGRFLLTIGDHPQARRIFAPFRVTPVRLRYSCGRSAASRSKDRFELLVESRV